MPWPAHHARGAAPSSSRSRASFSGRCRRRGTAAAPGRPRHREAGLPRGQSQRTQRAHGDPVGRRSPRRVGTSMVVRAPGRRPGESALPVRRGAGRRRPGVAETPRSARRPALATVRVTRPAGPAGSRVTGGEPQVPNRAGQHAGRPRFRQQSGRRRPATARATGARPSAASVPTSASSGGPSGERHRRGQRGTGTEASTPSSTPSAVTPSSSASGPQLEPVPQGRPGQRLDVVRA